jgi:hypothetical protein
LSTVTKWLTLELASCGWNGRELSEKTSTPMSLPILRLRPSCCASLLAYGRMVDTCRMTWKPEKEVMYRCTGSSAAAAASAGLRGTARALTGLVHLAGEAREPHQLLVVAGAQVDLHRPRESPAGRPQRTRARVRRRAFSASVSMNASNRGEPSSFVYISSSVVCSPAAYTTPTMSRSGRSMFSICSSSLDSLSLTWAAAVRPAGRRRRCGGGAHARWP